MKKPRILIATSDPALAEQTAAAMKEFASPLPYSLRGSEEAIGMTEELNPDLVLIDCELPGDCVETGETIQKSFSIPVIFMADRADHPALRHSTLPPCCVLTPVSARALEPIVDYIMKSFHFNRRELGAALHESERMFSTLIGNLPGFVYRCANDRDWTMEFISDGCLDITGYAAADFIGNRRIAFNDIIQPEYREPLWKKWQDVLREGKHFEDEYPIITAGGETRWVWERGRGVYSDEGRLLFLEGFITDITARKRAIDELGSSEERYRLVYENAAEGIITYNKNFVIIDANRRAEEISGYSRSEVVGKTVIDAGFLHPDDVQAAAGNMLRLLSGVKILSNKYRFIRKDGNVRTCLVTGAAIRDNAGHVQSVTSIVTDVTEQAQYEEALKASDERYRALFQYSAEGILVADTESMRFVQANPAICSFLGYPEDELLKLGVTDIHPPEAQERARREFHSATDAGSYTAEDLPCLRKDGTIVYADVIISAMTLDGKPSTVGLFVDITKRKEAERELAQSEEKFRSVVEKSHMGIAIVNDRAEYIYVNDEFCRIAGYPSEQMLGKNFDFPLTDESRALAVDRYVRRQRGEKVPDHYEFSFVRGDKSIRTGEVRSAVYPDSLGRMNSLIQILDVTEKKKADEERRDFEAKIQQAQKLESLGVLAGGIAHDFNNLLMAILGNIDLALMDLSPAATARDNLNEAAKASQRAADLCRQMLAYSGKGRFVVEKLGINELIEEMGRMLAVSISKKVSLKYMLGSNLPFIQADGTQLRQVIMNLVINASDAMGDRSGVVSITTGSMHCDRHYLDGTWLAEQLPEGYYVFVEVSDTGCGMDQETMKKIFDPFFTTKFTGRGLGLAAVLGIVRGHRGAIKVYSEPGSGTTFKVLLPAVGEPGETAKADNGCLDGWTASGAVLLVDDEETVRSLGIRMLERCGFTVLTASDGHEALDVYRKHVADIVCVILDLTMPRMDGEETFRNLRIIDSGVRVIMSSGYNEQEVTARFAGKGLVGFIQKPYRFEELVKKLRAILE